MDSNPVSGTTCGGRSLIEDWGSGYSEVGPNNYLNGRASVEYTEIAAGL